MKTKQLGFVLDSNVIVSAMLIPDSTPRQAFDRAQRLGKLLLSMEILTELKEVLSRRKLDNYMFEEERDLFFALLVKEVP